MNSLRVRIGPPRREHLLDALHPVTDAAPDALAEQQHTAPEPTGRREWDAALAGITKYRLNHVGIPLPDWTRGVRADEPTIVSGSKRPKPISHDAVPQELLARNVLIERVVLSAP